jgi:hypothetical protein
MIEMGLREFLLIKQHLRKLLKKEGNLQVSLRESKGKG